MLIQVCKMLHSASTDGLYDFDDMEVNADIAGFGDDLLLPSKSEIHDLCLGISPTHSSDSGVDNIEEYMFDFENISCYSNDLWKAEGRSFEDGMVGVSDDISQLERLKESEIWSHFKIPRRTKLEETIDEDHCYTSRVPEDHSLQSVATKALHMETQNNTGKQASYSKVIELPSPCSMLESDKAELTERTNEEMLEELACKSTSDRCGNRNAVMARLNRERKKKYVSNLESEVSTLRKQNASLSEENQNLKVSISDCREELAYLRNVLENQSMLSSVITAVSGVVGVNLKGIVKASNDKNKFGDKRSISANKGIAIGSNRSQQYHKAESENGEQNSAPFISEGNGVCLHVQQENVSIEFCHHCSAHATS